jgi:hypothetical protein
MAMCRSTRILSWGVTVCLPTKLLAGVPTNQDSIP